MEELVVEKCNNSIPEKQSRLRGTYFAVIIYPEEDINHRKFLDYVLFRPQYEVVYIDHPADEASGVNKTHTHAMIHVKKAITVGSFVKFFDPWIKYAECIKDPLSYISYMLHDTPHAIDEGKVPFSFSDLKGDRSLWKGLEQNSNFVQYGEFISYFQPGMSLGETLNAIRLDRGEAEYERFFDYVQQNSYFIQNYCKNETEIYFKRLYYGGKK